MKYLKQYFEGLRPLDEALKAQLTESTVKEIEEYLDGLFIINENTYLLILETLDEIVG